jgi:TolA-binding protein
VLWTPTVLILAPSGVERFRIEGYSPNREFRAQLELALARAAFMNKQWADAERLYAEILERYPDSYSAPEAQYWTGVAHYKGTLDHTALEHVVQQFKQRYQDSIWAKKASVLT